MAVELGQIIAERRLTYTDPDTGPRNIVVKLGAPQQRSDRPDHWYCPWQIVGVGAETVKYAAGVDGFHALQVVMRMIGATLHSQVEINRARLDWFDENDSDLGFPNG
jgi:hypothetical protein